MFGTSTLGGETWVWGALHYSSNTFESNSGTYSMVLSGTAGPDYYLSFVLDTATTTGVDIGFPSYGAFNSLTDLPPPSIVPVPTAFWLFGSALGLLGWIRRKTT
jgi:hypothetical protein